MFKIPNIIKAEDKEIYILPKKIRENPVKLNKICTNLKNKDIYNVILSKKLLENEEIKNVICQNQINIFNGKMLMQYLTYDFINYIAKIEKEKLEDIEVSILVNEVNDIKLYMIIKLAKTLKRVNIVTNHINKFKKIERSLYEENGIMITVTNNKKKSLLKSKYIVNYDFMEDVLNEYRIYTNSIIINIDTKVIKCRKSFNGILINYYDIEYNKNQDEKMFKYDIYQEFYKNNIYESEIEFKNNFQNIVKKIEEDKLNIKCLIGKNGEISNVEFKNLVNVKV